MPYMQIYLLTVLANFLAGATLARTLLAEKIQAFKPLEEGLAKPAFQLVLGIVTALTGIFALFKFNPGDIVILGDLLPALAALLSGALLIAPYFSEKDQDSSGAMIALTTFAEKHGSIIGITTMSIALLHAIIPNALFL